MNRLSASLASFASAGLLLVSGLACADDPAAPPMTKRQAIKNCMTRQMTADRTVHYNAASKICRERVKAQSDKIAANSQTKQ